HILRYWFRRENRSSFMFFPFLRKSEYTYIKSGYRIFLLVPKKHSYKLFVVRLIATINGLFLPSIFTSIAGIHKRLLFKLVFNSSKSSPEQTISKIRESTKGR